MNALRRNFCLQLLPKFLKLDSVRLLSIDLSTDPRARSLFDSIINQLHLVKQGQLAANSDDISYWEKIAQLVKELDDKKEQISELDDISSESTDPEFLDLARNDRESCRNDIEDVKNRLIWTLVRPNDTDFLSKCQIEIISAVGGQESMLFAKQLCDMYSKFAFSLDWAWTPLEKSQSGLAGGLKYALASLSGPGVYRRMKFEAGVHRVQRVPITEKGGRMHTSTVCITVLPEPTTLEVVLNIRDCHVETMRASGPGGQLVNTLSSAVRVTHRPTGFSVFCSENRSQNDNLGKAYQRLAALILQRQQDEQDSKLGSQRRLQVGLKARSEKIRTYNFKDNKVIDHRLKKNWTGVETILQGGKELQYILDDLAYLDVQDRLMEMINSDR